MCVCVRVREGERGRERGRGRGRGRGREREREGEGEGQDHGEEGVEVEEAVLLRPVVRGHVRDHTYQVPKWSDHTY